jgi:hypothetical protein
MKSGILYICGYPWEVKIVDRELVEAGKAVDGITDKDHSIIYVTTKNTTPDKVFSTTIHEVLHACFSTVTNAYPDEEEAGVQALETALFSILSDPRNKWIRQQVTK